MFTDQIISIIIFGTLLLYIAPMLGILSRIKIYKLTNVKLCYVLAFMPVINLIIFIYIYGQCY
ncbi:MAG: hypothetical protein [Wendovervirus sonii]|uniref:Uncharacterized protein n=1 Tax=phage Lak_Megaphage_Sonny TaxID=3109229 RepID=A0ABZ0Z3U0_9CAUD|nr:MAG: hypothetical protein [phage Lak_Megaphage_Sonny]